MKSLKLSRKFNSRKRDISFDSLGKLQWVEDNSLIIQSLNLRLETELGELFYNNQYGHPKFQGKINEESLTIFIKDTLFQDDRVFNVELIEYYRDGLDEAYATILIELNNGEEVTLNLPIGG